MNARNLNKSAYYPWLVWGLGAAFFFCEYFARVSTSVMVKDLMQAFQVGALGIGTLSAFFYYPYVALQIPVGLLVDKYGVRRLLITMSLLTGIGCVIFGAASLLSVAQLGRFLLGFGGAFAFVCALKLAAEWFPATQFGLLAGLTQALGMIGAAVGEAPVSFLVHSIGWRETMYVMAVIFVILSVFITIIVSDKPQLRTEYHPDQAHQSMLGNLMIVLRNPQSWYNAVYAGLIFAPTGAFAELWGVSYLETVHHLSESSAAAANGMIFLGWGVGGPLMGWLSDRMRARKPMMYVSAWTGLVILAAVLFIPHLHWVALYTLLFLFGISNAGVGIAYAVSAEINPKFVSGASMAFANMMSVIIGALLQPIIGGLLDAHSSGLLANGVPVFSASDYHFAMAILPVCLFLAVFCVLGLRETHCQYIYQTSETAEAENAENFA